VNSCSFSGRYQIFSFPSALINKEYSYIKLLGHGNSFDKWNYISEIRVFGNSNNGPSGEDAFLFKLYPNPAADLVSVSFARPAPENQLIRLINCNGVIVDEIKIDAGAFYQQVPINLNAGFYFIQILSDGTCVGAMKLVVIN